MDKLFKIFLSFSSETNEKKIRILVNVGYYFCSIIISIWLGYKLGFEFNGFNFSIEYFVGLFADLSIIIPLFLFLIVNSISIIIVYLLVITFYIILKIIRNLSYKKAIRKNNILILKQKRVIDYKEKKVIKGKRFDEYISMMIANKNILIEIEDYPKKTPVVIFSIWFIYVQIIRIQFENLYFCGFVFY